MPGGAGIVERLEGKHVLMTGVTGFVGQALLHRLLADVPGCRTSVLVRPRGSTTAQARVQALLKRQIFADVVLAAGGVDELIRARVQVLEGGMSRIPALPPDLDAVVHCAGDVSFAPPVDAAFTTNVVGTRDLLTRIAETGREVHYVHISTAYVAGRRSGAIAEGPVAHDVDVEAELCWGLAQGAVVEQRSRESALLSALRAAAEREHRQAGLLTAAAAAEERRREWVREELVRLGTERARSLGWTDCYTFTKAMGERVVESWADRLPVSIVRPSIVESAVGAPHPGWIEGYKMAEPLILAYGRGEIPEFPAAADTTIDLVPVDHVVAATIAVLAHPPVTGRAEYFHVSSGARNPLTFAHFYACVRRYFSDNPFEIGDRGAARLPDWRFPGAQSVERLLVTSEWAHRVAGGVIALAPRSDRARDLADKLDQQGRRLDFLRRYLDLYREYLEADLHFDDTATMALFTSLDAADREKFAFDTSVVDWDHYVCEVHCPAITASTRRLEQIRRRRASGTGGRGTDDRTRVRPDARAAAFFDMDGTLLSSNVIETYLWARLQELPAGRRFGELARTAARLPGYLAAERHERHAFLRSVYRNYAGARLADLERIADDVLTDHVLARLAPAAVRRIREHRAAGHPTVLITGAIRPLTRPLRPLFDHIEAAELAVDDRGVCTGRLAGSPKVGEARAAWVRSWAQEHDVELSKSYGYADSYSDLPLLEAVGRPVVVRPDVRLFRHARGKHWTILDWASSAETPRTVHPRRGR